MDMFLHRYEARNGSYNPYKSPASRSGAREFNSGFVPFQYYWLDGDDIDKDRSNTGGSG